MPEDRQFYNAATASGDEAKLTECSIADSPDCPHDQAPVNYKKRFKFQIISNFMGNLLIN